MGVLTHLAIGMTLGVLFAYLVKLTSDRYYYLKGLGFGVFIWLFLGISGTVFELPKFKDIPPDQTLIIFLGAMLFGLVNAYALRLIARRTALL